MSKTKIEWTDDSWNPISGCTPISEGCAHCYAARMAKRLAGRYGYPKDEPFKPGWPHLDKLNEPYHWRTPRRAFVCSMGDLFHDDVPAKAFSDVMNVILDNPQHTFILLTKRPLNMKRLLGTREPDWKMACRYEYELPLKNLWLGVTAENQRTADERIPILLQIPAAVRFVSVEPMLEPVDLTKVVFESDGSPKGCYLSELDWVICGPETGPGARPCKIDWVRDLQRQCAAASVPFFDKKDMLGEGLQEWPA